MCSFVYDLVRRTAPVILPRLHEHIRQTVAYTARLSGKRSDRAPTHAPLRALINHMASAAPDLIATLATDATRSLTRDGEGDAVVAADTLALLCAPGTRLQHSEEVHVLTCLLSASKAKNKPALRLKVTNLLPGIARSLFETDDVLRCRAAVVGRLTDVEASVRAAALRSAGALTADMAAADVPAVMDKMLERLRDVAEPVRSMVRFTPMPGKSERMCCRPFNYVQGVRLCRSGAA